MQTHHSPQVRVGAEATTYPPIESVRVPTVPTAQAAFYLNRTQYTLRVWAMGKTKRAPLKPRNIGGRLAWPVADIRRLLGVGVA